MKSTSVARNSRMTRCSCGEYVLTERLQTHKLVAHPEKFGLPQVVAYTKTEVRK